MIGLNVIWHDTCVKTHCKFRSEGAAFVFCRDNLDNIARAQFAHTRDDVIYDGNLVCQKCCKDLLPSDVGIYPICEGCDD